MRTLTPELSRFWCEQLPALPAPHQALILHLLQQHYGPRVLDIVNAGGRRVR